MCELIMLRLKFKIMKAGALYNLLFAGSKMDN